ncbi:hypothetical protein GCM10009096_33790 [Parasphingorhabdus litoris]|uniref:Helix-turn-helix domain-containing protein n=1 Tax=Parasphingorhabdus litoris TaxID=394733 RepID=A0ABN1B0X3_9SPHN|nr:hypothetical protein [Parasphingorhabdus litoris]
MTYDDQCAKNIDGKIARVTEDGEYASPTPRHDGWTPDIRVRFLEALANCGNISAAAKLVQRSRRSAYNLKRRDMNFSRGWDAAILLSRDIATDILQDRAINGIEEEVYHQGEVVGTKRRYDSRLLLAHIGRLDKLAERVTVSRGAARFGEMMDAIAAEEDTAPLISEPTTDEIVGLVAESEAEAAVRQIEATCRRENSTAAQTEQTAMEKRDEEAADNALMAAADEKYGPVHEIDYGDGEPVEYCRMTMEEAKRLMANHPAVKAHPISRDDPGYVATIVAPNMTADWPTDALLSQVAKSVAPEAP